MPVLAIASRWHPDIETCSGQLIAWNNKFLYLFSEAVLNDPHPAHIANIWSMDDIRKYLSLDWKEDVQSLKNLPRLRQACSKINPIFNGNPGCDRDVAARREISRIYSATVKSWLRNPPTYITDVMSINEGPCGDFAEECLKDIEQIFPDLDIVIRNTEHLFENDDVINNFYHVWLEYKSTAYDAESPEGTNASSLPFFKRNSYSIFSMMEPNQSFGTF